MRTCVTFVLLVLVTSATDAQLLDAKGKVKIELAAEVPKKLAGDATVTFDHLDIVFDGGSRVATLKRGDGRELELFFPHSGYWTPEARRARTQPIAVLVRREKQQVLVEIKQGSALQKRLVRLLNDDLRNGPRTPALRQTLTRIRNCVTDRKPLSEIEKLMDPATGEFRSDDDSFGNPFE